MRTLLYFVLTLFAAPNESTLQTVQNKWDETKTYQADFKQTIFSKRLGTKEETKGVVSISRPGKLRWEAETDRMLQILNGKKFFHIHLPKRRRAATVDIYEDIAKKADIRFLSFLSGKTEFRKAYQVDITKETAALVELKLVPKDAPKGRRDSETYIAEFDKKGYVLAALTTESPESRVRIEFSNIQVNGDLKDDLFDYKPAPEDMVKVNK